MMLKTEDAILVQIYDLLYQLGLTANYVGFFHIAHAIRIAYQNPVTLQLVTKWLYPEVADYCNTTWTAVEKSIRYAIKVIWKEHPNRLCSMSGRFLVTRPAPAKFISILVSNLSSA